jgi:hypothetical protein
MVSQGIAAMSQWAHHLTVNLNNVLFLLFGFVPASGEQVIQNCFISIVQCGSMTESLSPSLRTIFA